MSNDQFAPPTKEELDNVFAPPNKEELDTFAPPTAEETGRPATAIAAGAIQGAAMDWADEAAATVKAGWDAAINQTVPKEKQDSKEFKQRYNEELVKVRDYLVNLEKENPKAFLGGKIAGGVASLAIPAGPAVKGLTALVGTGKLAKPVLTTLKAAITGGVAGAGASEATETGELAGDVAKGAALGGVLGTAVPAAGAAIKGAGSAIKNLSEFAQKQGLGIGKKVADPEVLTKFARDNNILTSNIKSTLENANKIKDQAAESLVSFTKKVQESLPQGQGLIDKDNLVANIQKIYAEQVNNGQNALARTTKQLLTQVKAINPTDFNQIRQIKSNIGEELASYATKEGAPKYRVASQVYGELSDSITAGLDKLERIIPDAKLAQEFKAANSTYRAASQVASAAQKKAESEAGDILSSVIRRPANTLGPAAAGAIGLATGVLGVPVAAATTIAAYASKKFGPTTAAKIQQLVENPGPLREKVTELVQSNNISELAALVNKSAQRAAVTEAVEPTDAEREQRKQMFKQLKMPQ